MHAAENNSIAYSIKGVYKLNGHILLIEDEVNIAKFVELELKHENFMVTVSYDGREGAELALSNTYDLLLVDVMLPSLNGLEICRRVRQKKKLLLF